MKISQKVKTLLSRPKVALLVGVSASCIAAAAMGYGWVTMTQHAAPAHRVFVRQVDTAPEQQPSESDTPDQPQTEPKEKTERTKAIDKAKNLREKWQVWAMAHKGALMSMISSKVDNEAALQAVAKSIPKTPKKGDAGLTPSDLMPQGDIRKAFDSGEPIFSWQFSGYGISQKISNPKEKERFAKSQAKGDKRMQKNFRILRDAEISVCVIRGSEISLWATGRITEQQIDPRPVADFVGDPKEIMPVYDFLKRAKS